MLAIIPVYKEKKIEQLLKVVTSTNSINEVILVNDSDDESFRNYYDSLKYPKLRVIHLPKNMGKDKAVLTAIDNSSHDKIINLDADLQNVTSTQLDRVSQLLNEYECVFLIRGVDIPIAKFLGSTYLMLGEHAFKRHVIEKYRSRLFTEQRWNFDNELNNLVIEGLLNVKYVEMQGVGHIMKSKKYGFLIGNYKDLIMMYKVIFGHYKVWNFFRARLKLSKLIRGREIIS